MWPDQIGRRVKLRQLEVLFAVTECGTMGKAAERLRLSQPVISKAIADLEHTLGVRLLDRGPQGAEPTLYGRALMKRSVAIFDELRQGVGEIQFLADPTAGELRVGCGDSMLAGLLPIIIDKLSVRHPRLTFRVSQAPSGAVLYRELRERNIDVILGRLAMPPTEEEFVHELLFDEKELVVTGPQSPWCRRRSIELAELINERWILPPSDCAGGAQVAKTFRACGLDVPHAAVFSHSTQLFDALASSGRFLAMLPASVLSLGAKRSTIKVLPVKLRDVPWPIGTVTLRDRTISPVTRLFIECAREVARPMCDARPAPRGVRSYQPSHASAHTV
jgi:DNA-binding transcriptional LysR family regulator